MVFKLKNAILLMVLLVAQSAFAQQKKIPWVWQKNTCQNCGIEMELVGDINAPEDMDWKEKSIRASMELDPSLSLALRAYDADATARTQAFLKTLSAEKQTILNLYGIDSQEYNLLAHIAVGILGQETRFFANYRYFIKRNSQWGIHEAKVLKSLIKDYGNPAMLMAKLYLKYNYDIELGVAPNSKGPTQIKNVPDRIAQHYNFDEKGLWNPNHAAVATIGYLIEALKELRQRARNNNWNYINDQTIVDYLPYLYFGGVKKLKDGTATPATNIYVKNMKKFMGKVRVYEIVP